MLHFSSYVPFCNSHSPKKRLYRFQVSGRDRQHREKETRGRGVRHTGLLWNLKENVVTPPPPGTTPWEVVRWGGGM